MMRLVRAQCFTAAAAVLSSLLDCGAASDCPAPETTYLSQKFEDDETADVELLQHQVKRSGHMEAIGYRPATSTPCPSPAPVVCDKNFNAMCSGDQCCSQYSKNFSCPTASPEFMAKGCDFPKVQTNPTKLVYPPLQPVPHVGVSYRSEFELVPGEPLAVTLKKRVPGLGEVIPIDREYTPGTDYYKAFHPPIVSGSVFYEKGYASIWGDLGSEFQPGFGGVANYSVVHMKPAAGSHVSLYHMGDWDEKNFSAMCDIWWGFESTYATNLLQANINVATCRNYTALVQCNMTDDFIAILGQGWNINEGCFQERTCATRKDGKLIPRDWVARELMNANFPIPDPNVLQVVAPACLLAKFGAQCRACPLHPDDEEALKNEPNLAKYMNTASGCYTEKLKIRPAEVEGEEDADPAELGAANSIRHR